MSTTAATNQCPKCGAPVPGDAPQALCPKCVLAEAAAHDPHAAPTATGEIPTIERIAAAFPQLEIIELIGRGGMGFVFKARQPRLDRFVALKLLPDKLARDPHFAERFNREGRFLAKLNHPNIVSVFDFGQTGGFYFLMMEFVDGVNLRQAMQAGKFSPTEALSIVPNICEALHYAHEQGVLHRDIKPENILLDAKGRVKIADFGIAKLVGEDKPSFTLTGTGTALGTPHYMAPEQLEKSADIDHRADIYSLGVVFYEMLTGELPIGRFKPPSQRTPLDTRIDEIVLRALERERELRQKNAKEFKTQVEHVAANPTPPPLLTAAGSGPHGTAVIPDATLVKRPAQALLVAGLFNWIGSVIVVALLAYTALGDTWPLSSVKLAIVLVAMLGLSSLIIIGALKMMRLEAYPLAVLGSVLAMITSPGSIIGFPIGIWALVTLCQRDVRAAFRARLQGMTGAALPQTLHSHYSQKAIWGAAIVAFSLLFPLVLASVLRRLGVAGSPSIAFTLGLALIPGIAGTILGCVALSDIRAGAGRVRGLPLAVFGALTWPVLILLGLTVIVPMFTARPAPPGYSGPTLAQMALLIVPVGAITFSIWAVYSAAHWGAGRSMAPQRRGVLKWIFAALLLTAVAAMIISHSQRRRATSQRAVLEPAPSVLENPNNPDTNLWIRFTFTSVDVRDDANKRWLAFDYVEHIHGNCRHAFRNQTKAPGFTGQTVMSSFRAKEDDFPDVLHHRVSFLLPPSISHADAQQLRIDLSRMVAKSIKVHVDEETSLFNFPMSDGGIFAASIGVKQVFQ